MNHTVYLKLSQITELTHKDVVLKDVAQVYCDDQNVMNKCNSMKVMTVKVDAVISNASQIKIAETLRAKVINVLIALPMKRKMALSSAIKGINKSEGTV